MNILGIGPGELVLILVITLLVVGPDRLPELARQGGRMLVTVRNWVQRSPDAAMVLRARQEIEQELALLRSSLLEVQHVRNEVIEAARQVGTRVTEDVLGTTREALSLAGEQLGETQAALNGQPVSRGAAAPEPSIAPPQPEPDLTAPEPSAAPPQPEPDVTAPAEIERLSAQVRAVLEELRAMQSELRQRGLLSAGDTQEREP